MTANLSFMSRDVVRIKNIERTTTVYSCDALVRQVKINALTVINTVDLNAHNTFTTRVVVSHDDTSIALYKNAMFANRVSKILKRELAYKRCVACSEVSFTSTQCEYETVAI